MGRGRRVGAVAFVGCLLIAGCSAGRAVGPPRTAAARTDVFRRAQTAGVVMQRARYAVASRYAAYDVVGSVPDGSGTATILALRADGTTWRGTVVLAIRSDDDSAGFASSSYLACFRYDFRHRTSDVTPHQLDSCPPGPPLRLRPPPPPIAVDDATAATVRRTLEQLPVAQRVRAAGEEQALRAALGGHYLVEVDPPTPTAAYRPDVLVDVVSIPPQTCLVAYVSPRGAVTVRPPAQGTDCMGG